MHIFAISCHSVSGKKVCEKFSLFRFQLGLTLRPRLVLIKSGAQLISGMLLEIKADIALIAFSSRSSNDW